MLLLGQDGDLAQESLTAIQPVENQRKAALQRLSDGGVFVAWRQDRVKLQARLPVGAQEDQRALLGKPEALPDRAAQRVFSLRGGGQNDQRGGGEGVGQAARLPIVLEVRCRALGEQALEACPCAAERLLAVAELEAEESTAALEIQDPEDALRRSLGHAENAGGQESASKVVYVTSAHIACTQAVDGPRWRGLRPGA